MATVVGSEAKAGIVADGAERPGEWDSLTGDGHEQVVFCHDAQTGLRAIIAIYSTSLGPALGGTRIYPYPSESAAVADALNLSKAMAYKNALAGLDYGGGKAVIIGKADELKSEALLRAYGRFVQSLNGRYVTSCDVGTDSHDLDIVARECRFVAGKSTLYGGGGDPSPNTALGVYHGMRAAAEYTWGAPALTGRVVGVDGVGKVGYHLVGHLIAHGAQVLVHDISDDAVQRVVTSYPDVTVVPSHDELLAAPIDVYAPCALGGVIDDAVARSLHARIVCGCANNQLAHPGVEKLLAEHGIVYAPDYLVNAGGVIHVADELDGFNAERVKVRVEAIFDTTRRILAAAEREGVTPAAAADRIAERRMAEIGRLRGIWLGR